MPQLPVFPVKGQMLSLQGPREALKRVIFGPGTYLVPREDGLIVVGATSERDAGFAEGLTLMGRNNCKRASPACYQQRPIGRRWSVGGGSGPAPPMKALSLEKDLSQAFGLPPATTAMGSYWPQLRLN